MHRELSEAEDQLSQSTLKANASVTPDESVEYERRSVRALSWRKQKITQEKGTAERLAVELEATLAKLERVREQRPSPVLSAGFDATQQMEEKKKSLQEQAADLGRRMAGYASLRERLDQESRAAVLADAETLLAAVPGNGALRARLEALRPTGTLEQCEQFLRLVYQARSERHTGQGAEQQDLAVGRRLLAARLMVENLRSLAQTEREELLDALAIADGKLDKKETAEADRRLGAIEQRLDSYRNRDVGTWVREEQKAQDALRAARSLSLAMEEDEGMRELLGVQGKETEFKSYQDLLQNASTLFAAGHFEAATGIAIDQAEKLGRLRDEVLSTENRARIKALAESAREAMKSRGFTDVQVTPDGTDWHIQGQRGATAFWVSVHEEGAFEFDLGKEGFSSQTECWAEIDAFLQVLRSKGVHLNIRFADPMLDPSEVYDPNRLPEQVTQGGSVPTWTTESQRLKEGK